MVELEGECQFSGDSGRWDQIATCSAGSCPSVSWSYLLILRCIYNVNNTMCSKKKKKVCIVLPGIKKRIYSE